MNKLTLINPYIHQEAKLKKDKFLDRIKNVQQIRACYLERNFLPGEDIEWEILEELHKAINTGMFSFGISNYKIFAFEINKELYDWFKNNDLKTIQKQVINWIAAAYLSRPDMQEYLDEYIYSPILSEVKNVICKHYTNDFAKKYNLQKQVFKLFELASDGQKDKVKSNTYESSQEEYFEENDKLYSEKEKEYNMASLSYINCLPPKFLMNPLKESNALLFDDFGLKNSPFIRIRIAYFTKSDWIFIIERDLQKAKELFKHELDRGHLTIDEIKRILKDAESDTLSRSESDREIWNNWLYSYKKFKKNNNHIFRLFEEDTTVGLIYIVRQRNTNYFKIGWTERKNNSTDKQAVEIRISSLQTGNPEPIDIVGFFKASGTKTERTLHRIFESKKRTGEWFLLTDSDWKNILNDDWRISNKIF
ncbi:MAG: GIY-YIG nuclease family protein [Chitinophagales bacterium]|nr:GIY-YIG nuclease family protein [Chitinophagales bacterium]HMZ93430.1 GIY-YIG nuclease family protein [Chitinophagales bacterium]HNB38029.1 GIY-YIG nuclease family protein [Chitinophagales bacterium]